MIRKLPIHYPLFIAGSVVIVLFGLMALFLVLNPNHLSVLVAGFEQKFGIQKLVSSSNVEISRVDNSLRLEFDILDEDRQKAADISRELGISEEWEKGITLGLDPKSLGQLEGVLPLKANIGFENKKIVLSSGSFNLLKSSLSQSNYEYSTGSAKLNWSNEGNKYRLVVKNPDELLVDATSSGKLNLSKKINGVFQIGEKIDTIDLNIVGKSLEGEIVLK